MDGERFDRLTRTLTAPLSRRVTLGGLAAGILLSLGLALDETTVLAKKKNKKKGKGKDKKKNKKKKPNCFDLIPCGDECCARSESCCGNHCCLPFQTCCGAGCCSGEETCRDGTTCVSHCNDGVQNFRETDTDCGGSCRNVRKCQASQGCGEDADCESDVCVFVAAFSRKICVPCRDDADCARNASAPERFRFCLDNTCNECKTSLDCPAEKRCNLQTHFCEECVSDGDCGNAERPFCVAPLDGECPNDQPCVCRRCRTSDDCLDGVCDETNSCIGDTCAAGQDICRDGINGCNGDDNCQCRRTVSQQTVCVDGLLDGEVTLGVICRACSGNNECDAVTGVPGSFCIDFGGTVCTVCEATNNRGCSAPCPTNR